MISIKSMSLGFPTGSRRMPRGMTPWMKPTTLTQTIKCYTRTEGCDGITRVWLQVQKHGRSDAPPSPPGRSGRGRIHACGDCTPCGFLHGIYKMCRGTRKPRGRTEHEVFRDDETLRVSNHLTPRHFTEAESSTGVAHRVIKTGTSRSSTIYSATGPKILSPISCSVSPSTKRS